MHRIVGETYEIFERNGFIYIRGSANVTVEGNINIYAKNDCNVQVDGNLMTEVHGNHTMNIGGNLDIAVGGNVAVKSGGAMGWSALSMYIEAAKFGALKSPLFGFDVPVMPLSSLAVNAFLAQVESASALAASGIHALPTPVISTPPVYRVCIATGWVLPLHNKPRLWLKRYRRLHKPPTQKYPFWARRLLWNMAISKMMN